MYSRLSNYYKIQGIDAEEEFDEEEITGYELEELLKESGQFDDVSTTESESDSNTDRTETGITTEQEGEETSKSATTSSTLTPKITKRIAVEVHDDTDEDEDQDIENMSCCYKRSCSWSGSWSRDLFSS